MNIIQEKLVEYIQNDGLKDFIYNPKNTWLIVSGGYEEQMTAFLYHSFGGTCISNLFYETSQTDNLGKRITGDTVSERPDMIITGEAGDTKDRLVVAKIVKGRVIKHTDIPIIDYVQLGHDFANQVICHLNKFNYEYEKLKRTLQISNARADGLLHIQLVTEYINVSPEYERFRNSRGRIENGQKWINEINDQFNHSGFKLGDTKTYPIKLRCGLHVNVHVIFAYRSLI